jgi:hypothetical protein
MVMMVGVDGDVLKNLKPSLSIMRGGKPTIEANEKVQAW